MAQRASAEERAAVAEAAAQRARVEERAAIAETVAAEKAAAVAEAQRHASEQLRALQASLCMRARVWCLCVRTGQACGAAGSCAHLLPTFSRQALYDAACAEAAEQRTAIKELMAERQALLTRARAAPASSMLTSPVSLAWAGLFTLAVPRVDLRSFHCECSTLSCSGSSRSSKPRALQVRVTKRGRHAPRPTEAKVRLQ
jgi:hypothetical protein